MKINNNKMDLNFLYEKTNENDDLSENDDFRFENNIFDNKELLYRELSI